MTTKPDARRHPRFAVRIKAEVCTATGDVSAAITKDLSRGGICLVCPLEVQAGSALDLSLALVLGTNTFSEKLDLSARVVWCTPVDQLFQLGAMFVAMDREKTGYLEMFLRFIEQEVLVSGEPQTEPPGPPGPNAMFDTGDADKP